MKKVIRLKESDLVRIVKRVLQEQFIAQPDSTKVKMPNEYTPSSETSKNMRPKGLGRFEKVIDINKRFNGQVLPRLQIIFPGNNFFEEISVQFLKGIDFFSNDEHTYIVPAGENIGEILDEYAYNNIKFNQILIGTHGACSKNIDDLVLHGGKTFGIDLFDKIALLVNSNTHVYLTSCYAAGMVGGYIGRLHELAIELGCKVTGASGKNYYGYDSENGFYTCRPEGQHVGNHTKDYQSAKKYCSFSTSPPFTPDNINKLSNVYNNANTGVVDGVQKMVNTIFKK